MAWWLVWMGMFGLIVPKNKGIAKGQGTCIPGLRNGIRQIGRFLVQGHGLGVLSLRQQQIRQGILVTRGLHQFHGPFGLTLLLIQGGQGRHHGWFRLPRLR